jgi:hypothetical protein
MGAQILETLDIGVKLTRRGQRGIEGRKEHGTTSHWQCRWYIFPSLPQAIAKVSETVAHLRSINYCAPKV